MNALNEPGKGGGYISTLSWGPCLISVTLTILDSGRSRISQMGSANLLWGTNLLFGHPSKTA